ncbi:MAG: T9SS type A sorting domain-containing protein [Bacteroidota bacterium]
MKPLFTLFSFLFFFQIISLNAAHIVGGYMSYECLGGDDYRFRMVLYRDCFGGGAPFDSAPGAPLPGTVTVYVGSSQTPLSIDGQLFVTLDAPVVTHIEIDENTGNCLGSEVPASLCMEQGVYTFDLTLPSSNEPIHVVYQRCCRAATLSNIQQPGEVGMTLFQTITPVARAVCNSSPTFGNQPMLCSVIDQGQLFHYHTMSDADGDELIYTFCTPFTGGGNNTVNPESPDGISPNPDMPPPYTGVPFVNAIASSVQPIPGSPHFQVNAESGVVIGRGSILGEFLYGMCVSEYRNGQLLSTTRLEAVHHVLGTPLSAEDAGGQGASLRVYPNPAEQEIMLSLPLTNGNFSIHLFDMNGKKWKAMKDVAGGDVQLDISGVPSGIYVVKAIAGDTNYFTRLNIQ